MPLPVFELACVIVVLFALWASARRRPATELFRDYLALAIAAWIGEETCVAIYGYYHYASGWHARLHHVPALVPLIWPLVVLSARDVASSVWPQVTHLRPLLVGAIVAFDASLVEVVAVRAGLWSWAEPGHLGVPIIGMLGWGYFAIGADLALSQPRSPRLLAILACPLTAHALIQLTWWGFFRWTLRRDLGSSSLVTIVALSALVVTMVIAARRRGGAIPPSVALPRIIAASLFFALLATTAPGEAPLWIHTAAVAIPYLTATALRETRSPAAPPAATAPSR